MKLRRRKALRACDAVFVMPQKIRVVRHSDAARRCDGRRSMRGCETWVELLAWKMKGARP